MSGYSSIWVKVNNLQTDLPWLREHYNNTATLPDGSRFACAVKEADDSEMPQEIMQTLSERFSEAIFMNVQTTVDFFLYSHWRDGVLLREINYCADWGWYELHGEKQAWEQRLFSEEERLRQLSYLDLEQLAKNPSSADEYANAQRLATQITAVWTAQELLQECFYPMATASELYHIVMQEFGLANPY